MKRLSESWRAKRYERTAKAAHQDDAEYRLTGFYHKAYYLPGR